VQHQGRWNLLLREDDVTERLDDVSMITTIRLLADVRRELAHGADPEGEEPDGHKAVRLIEAEAIRAREAEEALRATCVALGNEKAQERELRLRAEAEVARMVDKFAERMEAGARDVARLEDECRRAVAAEVELKRAAYAKLDGCRKVVGETIIPALERFVAEHDICRPGMCAETEHVDACSRALAAARKLLED
jgi:hypothetical protein